MERIAAILERERQLLEHLLFKLVETRLILEHGEERFLVHSTREVDRARTRTREIDLMRATTVAQVQPGATLRDLAGTAPEPWPSILRDHHEVLAGLVAEIEMTAHRNAELARMGLDTLRAQPTGLPEAPLGADATSSVPVLDPSPIGTGLVEPHVGEQAVTTTGETDLAQLALGAALESVLGTAARLRMPALLTFLR